MLFWIWPVDGKPDMFYLVGAKDSRKAGQMIYLEWNGKSELLPFQPDTSDEKAQWQFIPSVPSVTDGTTEEHGTSATHYYIVSGPESRYANEMLFVGDFGQRLSQLRPVTTPARPRPSSRPPQARATHGSSTPTTTRRHGSCWPRRQKSFRIGTRQGRRVWSRAPCLAPPHPTRHQPRRPPSALPPRGRRISSRRTWSRHLSSSAPASSALCLTRPRRALQPLLTCSRADAYHP